MFGLLPFAILIVLGVLALGVWSGHKAIVAYRERRPIPSGVLIALLAALGMVAVIVRIIVALTIGLAHSRAPFEYTRLYAWACLALLFVVPGAIILAYHLQARSRK